MKWSKINQHATMAGSVKRTAKVPAYVFEYAERLRYHATLLLPDDDDICDIEYERLVQSLDDLMAL